jgi:xanthine dehydrogenase accessory factor
MSELRQIITAYEEYRQQQIKLALALIVHVEGSSYRRAGARMLITSDGRLTGAISGGCLESDVVRKAQLAIHTQKPILVKYDTFDEEEISDDIASDNTVMRSPGCEGIITIVIFPVDYTDNYNPIEILKSFFLLRKGAIVCTSYLTQRSPSLSPPSHWLGFVEQQTNVFQTLSLVSDNPFLVTTESGEWKRHLQTVLELQRHSWYNGIGDIQIFCEYIPPIVHLVIAGTGPDAAPLAEYAKNLGWEVSLVDNKASTASFQRFAEGCRVLRVKAEEVLEAIYTDKHTCFVLLTHNFSYDKALLPHLLQSEAFYVGMIGPKTKKEKMLDELAAENADFSEWQISKLYTPAGIDISAESPQEIALSIVAEILAVSKGVDIPSLRDRNLPIHV